MIKIFRVFFTGIFGFLVLTVLTLCLFTTYLTREELKSTQERLKYVSQHIGYLEDRLNTKHSVVYQRDSYDGNLYGKVKAKEQKDNQYFVEVSGYGWFLVTEEQFNELQEGNDIPDYLKEIGVSSNE